MSTRLAERFRGGTTAFVLGALCLGALQSCKLFDDDSAAPAHAVPTDVAPQLQAVLDTRAQALATGRERAFLATVDVDEPALRSRERRYFANLEQLPIGRLRYELVPGSLVATGVGVTAVVRRHLQLTPYDATPVVTPDRMVFTVVDGHYVIADDQDHEWQDSNDIEVPPWDVMAIRVRSVPGVLGIFDRDSVADADGLLADVQHGLSDVAALVPGEWPRQVVVYALSDTAAFGEIDDLPGGDPEKLDGVAFPVQAGPRSHRLAATRFVLHPRMVDHPGPARERLIRHELTHVAVGTRDDHVPVWLSEGLAEWVSVQPIPDSARLISEGAVMQARAGVDAMPGDDTFNGPDSGANYGIAWWACEWIATTHGPSMLWTLLDAMAESDGATDAEQDAVLRKLLGVDSRQLARRAAQRILATFS